MNCERCEGQDRLKKVHDRNDENIVKYLCDKCCDYPEYYTGCPHCTALILVN